ncbi:MAG: Ig-like domain-containing protein [Pseudoclavibacter sp.]|nr:Ig-like domain-containing protein [Pseudoclavibacter sp.]
MRQRVVRRRSRRQLLLSALLVLVLGVPVAIALLHEGFPASDVQLRARAVWVTNSADATTGRLNARIQELDASVSMPNGDVTVLQDGDTVFLHDRVSGSFGRVDPSYTDVRESVPTPPGSTSAMGGGRIAILEPNEGRLWTLEAAGPLSFDPAAQEPELVLGPGAQISVTPDGAVVGFSPSTGVLTRVDRPGAAPEQQELGASFADAELTTVGERAFVLDRDGNRLFFEDASVIAFQEPVVRSQLPGPESERIVLAGSSGLLEVPFGGGGPARLGPELSGGGQSLDAVARPVNIGECAHGAWAASRTVLRQCRGAEAEQQTLEQAPEGPIMFRVNRDVVALNDIRTGNTWLPQENLRLVENWQDIVPPKDQQGGDGDQEASEESFEDTLTERSDENHPPELIDDRFGVRAGAVAFLPVLDNDTDPDGDIITITEIQGQVSEALGRLRLVDQGRALQFEAAPGASGELTVGYRGTDGRPGGVAQANVTITILAGEAVNRPPVQRHNATITVEAGKQTTYNVLADWQEPDGDPIYLQSAAATDASGVSFTPDGRITFTATGAELGPRTVVYTVSDGETRAEGTLAVEVGAPGTLDPIGTPDFARGVAGTTITAQPLVNDLSPSGAPLEIVEIRELGSSSSGASLNTELGTVSYRSETPGTHYVQYTLRAGMNDSIGLIRFDVLDPAGVDGEIAAVQDVAFVRPERSTTVPVLANDMAVSDDVLSVQTVEPSDQARIAGVAVELVENQLVRITAPTAFAEPVRIGYTATDGERTADGEIVLVPVEPIANHQPPVARDDTRKVRVGDYTSVPVLDNDVHPDAANMTLDHQLLDPDIGDGFAFASGDRVRFQAPQEPGTYSLGYIVTDEYGEQASARVTFQVVADDESANRPPTPADQTVRVFEGASVLVNVPVTGIDPDGDSVSLKSVLTAPALGTVRSETETSFVYEAFPGSAGTDELRYEVVDGYGQRAEGVIRVAVVPRAEQTLPPVAVDDQLVARPGSLVAVPALANDSDPGGYPIELVDDFTGADPALQPRIDGDAVLVRVPEQGAFATLPYSITNGQGGSDQGWINITIDPNAPLAPPTAKDQVVPATAFDGRDHAIVDVREGASNPTGPVADLRVELSGPAAGLARVESDGTVRVAPSDRRQIIAFTLTSPESGLSGSGFIMVPRRVTDADKRQSPYLRPELPPQQTRVDTPIRWNVNDLVVADSGNRISVIEPEKAWAEQSDGSPVALDGEQLQFVPKPGFRGTASITFLASDAKGPNDDKAGVATIRLQITVGDPELHDVAPTFVTPQISIEAGSERTVDLAAATGHPNPAVVPQVRFSGLSGEAGGVTASLSGQQLQVRAGLQAQVGTIVPLQITYSFRDFTKTGTVNVTVVSSSQPPPRTVPDEADALRGQTVELDVVSNDFNPFPDTPLQLLEAGDVSASDTGASVSAVGGRIRVSTGGTFIGEISIRYRIADGTGDPNREAFGTARVRVRDVPSAPGSVALAAEGTGTLRASWDLSASNGEPIEEYELVLTPQGGGATITRSVGAADGYTFTAADGLNGGTAYTLQVRARNAIGWGPLSAVSPPATPLDRPSAPRNVQVHDASAPAGATSGELQVSWQAPEQTGGGLNGYRVTLVDSGRSWDLGAESTGFTLTGLSVPEGGESVYRVTVTAVNGVGEATSDVASGTLRYRNQDVSATLSRGAYLEDDSYAFRVQATGMDAAREYTLVCFIDGREEGRERVAGSQLQIGWESDDDDECAARNRDRNLAVEIYDDRGQHVATTNVVSGWGE